MSSSNTTSAGSDLPIESLSYEQAFSALEAILVAMESERQPLEDVMQLYERGQLLVRRCMELLEQAELKVRQLSGEETTDLSQE